MIRAIDLGWTWADGTVALEGVTLAIEAGEKVLVTGPSGCGKSTLVRLLAGLLQHHGAGVLSGQLEVGGSDPASWTGRDRASRIGVVFQDPGDQMVAGTVADEVAFGPMCAGVSVDVASAVLALGLHPQRGPHALSGGQQQRLAVAAGLAAGAGIAVLDEPLAHLDPAAASQLLDRLAALAGEGAAVVLIEHRVEAASAWADRVIVLREGQVVFDGPHPPLELLRGDGLQLPALERVLAAGGLDALGPVEPETLGGGEAVATYDGAAIHRGGRRVLAPMRLTLHAGERLAIVGPNGAGKSTLLEALADLPGAVWVPQDPDLSLFCATVDEEFSYGPAEWGRQAAAVPADFGLASVGDASPHALSRGQRQRVAVGAAVAVAPRILLLDEPTAGQHADAVEQTLARADQAMAGPMVFATHDLALALRWATRAVVLSRGELIADGPTHRVLAHLPLPPLQAAQAERGWPLADVDRQLDASGRGKVEQPITPAVEATEEGHTPAIRRDGSPVGPLLVVLTMGMLAVLLDRPITLAALAALGVVLLLSRPMSAVNRVRIMLGLGALIWSTLLSQGLFYGDLPRTALLQFGPVTVWREGIGWGLVQSLRLVAVSATGLAVALSLGPDRMLGGLRALRVPGGLAFLAVTALRFVPVVAGEWWVVRQARARRGRPLWRRGPIGWVLAEVAMLRPLVVRALRRARRLAESLDSRGFDIARVHQSRPRWTVADRAIRLASVLVLASVSGAQIVTGLYLAEVYHHPGLRPLYAWVRAWL